MLLMLFFILFIGMFIFGMTILRTGLFNLSAGSLKLWMARLTAYPIKGFLIGILVTAILQSSSAVMVITIGMISARLLTFPQSIGIILGTNIGTTLTAEFITFDLDSSLLPLSVTGAILIAFNHKKVQSAGMIIFGIATVFTAMRGFKYMAAPLSAMPYFDNLLTFLNDSHLFSIMAGTVITAIIQSSTAVIGMLMGFLTAEHLSLESAVAIMFGANIGTCITAYIASITAGREAKLAAYAHIWLNVLGVAAFFPFIKILADAAPLTADAIDVQLAHISVIFNVVSSIIILPFAERFGQIILWIHDRK
ncbi:Na/Pi cotransporter [Bacillus sp. V3-13]|uniref:Na/Pi symporter n=1 Tax=Bacillus sp. V3-13 TaxID=2053728 RepID=UPI000C7565A3|nr:Na/Pi symporter [Bacillus sp. V3-13]PLR78112.1 Na/Pi cotransporter [Bacillus sp. V3-13]